jgi:hypothetical protein
MDIPYICLFFYNMFRLIEPSSDIGLVYKYLYWSASIPTLASVYILDYWVLVICDTVVYKNVFPFKNQY